MSKASLNIAILGLGRAGNFHLQSLRLLDNARASLVFDVDADRAQRIADEQNCVAAASVEEVMESNVDAVIVATPTDLHTDLVRMCIAAGKPVLTEKPLARHLQQIDDCFTSSAAAGVPLFVAFQRRFDPAFASLASAVNAGNVGQLQFVRSVSRDNPVPSTDYIRISGGIFHDCMVHDLDMVCHIVGQVPTHVSSFGTSFISEIGELDDMDSVVASLLFPNGVTATIDINRKSVYGYDQRIEAFGDTGMLQADNYHRTSVTQANVSGFTRPPVDFSFPTRYREAYMLELQCFIRCVLGEQEVPITHHDVRTNHLLASGIELAAREKRVVAFDEMESLG